MPTWSKMLSAAVWTLLAAAPQARAQCVDYRDYLRPVCSLELPGLAWGAATDGNVALVTSSDGELRVIDLANPSEPIIAATVATGGEASGVEIRGRFGYVAAGEVGVVVVDLANPYAPEVVATVDTPGRARALCLSGDWAFVADLEGGVQVLDIADPRQANLVAGFCDSSFVQDIAVLDGEAYVAAGYDGLLVVDVRDPRHSHFESAVAELWDAAAVAAEILSYCLDAGGALTGEHGIGVDKACSMPKMFAPADLEVMQRVRRAFDPANICNPGKVFPTPRLCGEVPGPYRQHPVEAAGLAERV